MAFDVSRNISSCKNRKTLDVKKKILYTEAQVLPHYDLIYYKVCNEIFNLMFNIYMQENSPVFLWEIKHANFIQF